MSRLIHYLGSLAALWFSGTLYAQPEHEITLASWNMEHLTESDNPGCKVRSSSEYEKMKKYISQVNADIYALQEVASTAALTALFDPAQWNIYLSDRADSQPYTCRENGRTSSQQKVAIVVNKQLKVLSMHSLPSLGLKEEGLRYGLEAEIQTPRGVLTVLSLHLKSGCFVDDYSRSDLADCKILGQQVAPLLSWINQQEAKGQAYVMMGDFNHRLSAPYNRFTRDINESLSTESSLVLATRDLIGCHPWYPAPIDHIWVGAMDTQPVYQHAKVWPFEDMRPDKMLSDHCAVTVSLPG